MKIGELVGRAIYFRGKGQVYLEALRGWVIPVLGGGAALKYLGLPTYSAVALMLVVGIASEAVSILLGWVEHRSGATAAHYKAAALTDSFKVDSLRLSTEIRDGITNVRDELVRSRLGVRDAR